MSYRDAEHAAKERLARLEAELLEVAPATKAGLEEQLVRLEARRDELTEAAPTDDLSNTATPFGAKVAIVVAAVLGALSFLIPDRLAWLLAFALVPSTIAAIVSVYGLLVRVRESRG